MYYLQIVPESLRPGFIVHARHLRTKTGRLIRGGLSLGNSKLSLPYGPIVWGDHDALVCDLAEPQGTCMYDVTRKIGDSRFPRAVLTPVHAYNKLLAEGDIEVKILVPRLYTLERGRRASRYWIEHVNGSLYDVLAYPQLCLRCLLGEHLTWAANLKVMRFCTEGVEEAWRVGADCDVYMNRIPTPLTTEKRLMAEYGGTLEDKTSLCCRIVWSDLKCGED